MLDLLFLLGLIQEFCHIATWLGTPLGIWSIACKLIKGLSILFNINKLCDLAGTFSAKICRTFEGYSLLVVLKNLDRSRFRSFLDEIPNLMLFKKTGCMSRLASHELGGLR